MTDKCHFIIGLWLFSINDHGKSQPSVITRPKIPVFGKSRVGSIPRRAPGARHELEWHETPKRHRLAESAIYR